MKRILVIVVALALVLSVVALGTPINVGGLELASAPINVGGLEIAASPINVGGLQMAIAKNCGNAYGLYKKLPIMQLSSPINVGGLE